MNIKINYDKCTSCGLCVKVCGSQRIGLDKDGRPYKIIEAGCNDCGHCVAVCPVDAIINTRVDMSDYRVMTNPGISYESFTHLVRNRRSIRNFLPEQLKKEDMDKLMEVARYIPTGSNKQSLKYRFITDPDVLMKIKSGMASKMRTVARLANMFPVRFFIKEESRKSAKRLPDLFYEGNDTFLRGAPCLLVIYSDVKYFKITQWDAGIASATIDMTAQTLGIGTLMNGYFVVLSNRYRSIKKLTGLGGGQSILAAMCLGYPSVKYRKTVYRKPPDISVL